MLDCKTCISRCIRTILSDVLRQVHQPRLQRRLLPIEQRSYHSAHLTQRNLFRQDEPQAQNHPGAGHQTTQATSEVDRPYRTPPPTPIHVQNQTISPRVKPFNRPERRESAVEFRKKKDLDRELIYLQDPLKLAENTIALLRNDDNEKALDLVRLASKQTPCTVSWNHVVDYEMSKGRIQKAVKTYNEVVTSLQLV